MSLPSSSRYHRSQTSHALLCAAGYFAQSCGLIRTMRSRLHVPMKTVDHTPADKLLTFVLYIADGMEALTDAEKGHHPLSTDVVLAQSWDQLSFPHHTGVNTLLQRLTDGNVAEVEQVINDVSEPFLQQDIQAARRAGDVVLILDLTGEPVTDQSQSYPETAYGYMDGTLEKGYQLAAVSLRGAHHRTFLAGFHHPGNTVSAPCLHELIAASEARLGHPHRRPELIDIRIAAIEQERERALRLAQEHEQKRQAAVARRERCQQSLTETEATWQDMEAHCDGNQPLAPTGRLACLRRQRETWQHMAQRAEQQSVRATTMVQAHQATVEYLQQQIAELRQYQARLEAENASTATVLPIRLILDAGFTTAENMTWLIEQGYDMDGKPHAPAVAPALHRRAKREPDVQVNRNTTMIEVGGYQMAGCPYPLRWALCCQKQGQRVRYEAMFSYRTGQRPTLRQWFRDYHQRADVEAGFKQGKGIFGLGRFHTRSKNGIRVQEILVLFACNFMAWLRDWLVRQPSNRFLAQKGIKELVRVVGQAEATATINGMGGLLCFDARGPYPGQRLYMSLLPIQPEPTAFRRSQFFNSS